MNRCDSDYRAALARLRALVAVATVCGMCTTGLAAPDWWKDIPDSFQHQKWGAPAGAQPQPLNPIAGANDPGGDTLSPMQNGRVLSWELFRTDNPPFPAPFQNRKTALGSFNGWCNIATYTNQFYHFKQKGYPVTTGNVNNSDDLHNEVRALAEGLFLLGNGQDLTKDLNKVLIARNINPTKARDGLTAQNYKQDGNDVKFTSSTGVTKKLPKSTLFDHLQTAFKFGDTASLRLGYEGNPDISDAQYALWWRGPSVANGRETGAFHSVAVAGFDKAGNGTIFFADPDSNPTGNGQFGNKDDNAGWSEADGGLSNFNATASDNWLAAPGVALPVKQRRFGGGAAVPKPAGNAPMQAEQDKLYFPGTLADNKKQFSIADNDYNRYDTVNIRYVETLEAVKAGKKPRAPFQLGGDPFVFEVSPGQPDSGPNAITGTINEFLLSPANSIEEITSLSNLRLNDSAVPSVVVSNPNTLLPGVWNIYFYGENSIDPYGNDLPWGGLSIRAGAGIPALSGVDLFDFEYTTVGSKELTAWDFLYNDYNDNPCDDDVFQLCYESLGVQTLGGGYDLPLLQIPEPGTLSLLVFGGLALLRRKSTARGSPDASPCRSAAPSRCSLFTLVLTF